MEIPALGFGTYGRWGAEGEAALAVALETGYRHLDTAQTYNTEVECGRALAASGLDRGAVFVTTKITAINYGPGKLIPSLKASLEALQLDRVNLTLIHWPAPNGETPVPVYMEQLAEAQDQGLTDAIGVSNFTASLIDEALAAIPGHGLLTNQVELHPFLQNKRLEAHCRRIGVRLTAYRPIAEGRVGEDPVMQRIAAAHGATPAQVALAWHLAEGRIAIPTSGKTERIRENFAAQSLRLSKADIAAIRGLDRGERYIDPAWGPDWD
jgi:2,5-diketo-D-gluconate reductase B